MGRGIIKRIAYKLIKSIIPNIDLITRLHEDMSTDYLTKVLYDSKIDIRTSISSPAHIGYSEIDKYTYIALNSYISHTEIGKFCSIGPNFLCGWGVHPANGISTAPMFYSTRKQNGFTLSGTDKIEERKPIKIGNDVFIGANVTILDGVTIGDGVIIGAGAVVSKDIPPYAIAVGCPIKIIKYRFNDNQIQAFQRIKWWDFDEEKLQEIERLFFDVDKFLEKYDKEYSIKSD